jgi:chemotaxis protein MotB
MKFRILFFIPLFFLSSCIVTKKKFDDVLAQKVKAEGELADRTSQLEKANASITELNTTLEKLKQDTTELNETYRATSKKLEGLNKEYDQLNAYYKNLLNNSGKLNRDLEQQKDQLLAIQGNLENTRKLNDSLSNSSG